MVEFGIPKLLILMWNREIPTTEKWDAIDLFSGTGRVKESLLELGYSVASHDIEHHPAMDINSSAGFAWLILASFLSLKRSGPRWIVWVRDAPAGLFLMGLDESPHLAEEQLSRNYTGWNTHPQTTFCCVEVGRILWGEPSYQILPMQTEWLRGLLLLRLNGAALIGSLLQDCPGDASHPLVPWRLDSGAACKLPHAGTSSRCCCLAEMPVLQDQCLPWGIPALELEIVFILFEQAPGLHRLLLPHMSHVTLCRKP
ncbi:unnamed protein product [Symbiodinium sp. CCMP2456]|nr:unnamed protein product [Symbiodinium sp. CCMP2456]